MLKSILHGRLQDGFFSYLRMKYNKKMKFLPASISIILKIRMHFSLYLS